MPAWYLITYHTLLHCAVQVCLAVLQTKWAVLVFSWTAGVMYSTLFTMPYLLVAHYHETDTIHCEVLDIQTILY